MDEEIFFIRLRDCFTAGYTFPQFCIDNNIKKPLFVTLDERNIEFVWEIYVQFKYSKIIAPTFSMLNRKYDSISFGDNNFLSKMEFEKIEHLSFNEYDKVIVLNAVRLNVNFSHIIYLDQLTRYFMSRTYSEIPLLHFLQKHKGVKLFAINFPCLIQNQHNSDLEKDLLAEEGTNRRIFRLRDEILANKGNPIPTPYDFLGYTNEDVAKMLEIAEAKVNPDGSTSLQDRADKIMNITNGKRMTAYQPDKFINKIYFVGNCIYYGFGVPYDKTVESHLQKFLNDSSLPYCVENESQTIGGRFQDQLYNLKKLPLKSGDIVLVYVTEPPAGQIPFIDTNPALIRPHNHGEVFADKFHINELGHLALAKYFFQFLVKNNFFKNTEFKYPAPPPPPHRFGIPKENFFDNTKFIDNPDLENYKQKLRTKRLSIGAIVMNCNPFTFGHKALIEYAAARVHKLYIFVVEEDKSEFKFADRLELVRRGVEEFPNVEVIPSGQFIISQKTFEGYFNKENLQNVTVDSSQDVEIFAREIAPTLGINIRFAGEEPEDSVTRQYNENMKNILPRYGIDFCEIPRKEIDGEVISAKTVRAALKVGDFEKIAKLVPITTLEFLRKNYNNSAPPPLPVDEE